MTEARRLRHARQFHHHLAARDHFQVGREIIWIDLRRIEADVVDVRQGDLRLDAALPAGADHQSAVGQRVALRDDRRELRTKRGPCNINPTGARNTVRTRRLASAAPAP